MRVPEGETGGLNTVANQISDSKQRVYLTLDKDLVAQLDGRAAAEGKTRTAVITEALEAYVSGGSQGDVASAKLETVIAKLDSIKSGQDALKTEQKAQSALLAAKIDAQPISVQLPAAEPPQAEPEARKGVFARLFGR